MFWTNRGHRCRPSYSPPGTYLHSVARRVQRSHCLSICIDVCTYSSGPSIVQVSDGRKYRHYRGNRHYSTYCHYYFCPVALGPMPPGSPPLYRAGVTPWVCVAPAGIAAGVDGGLALAARDRVVRDGDMPFLLVLSIVCTG